MTDFTGSGTPLSSDGVSGATDLLGAAPEALFAVLAVETAGCGFQPDRRPKILFERHFFSRLTQGRFDADNPDVSAPTPGGYGATGAHQYLRLQAAMLLDESAAVSSASWGLGQIMGANHVAAGFDTPREMADAFAVSEDAQLQGMANFIAASGMGDALLNKDWAGFARRYNGAGFAKNHYDTKLAANFSRLTDQGLPDLDIRAAQVLLSYQGFNTHGMDGVVGPATRAALTSFQQQNNLTVTGEVNAETLAALAAS